MMHPSENAFGPRHEENNGERRTVAVINSSSSASSAAGSRPQPQQFASPISNSSPYFTSSTLPASHQSGAADFDHLPSNSPPPHSTLEHRRHRNEKSSATTQNGIESNNSKKKMANARYLHERGPSSGTGQFFYTRKFGVLLFLFEILFIILFALFVRYGEESDPLRSSGNRMQVKSPLEAHGEDQRLHTTTTPSPIPTASTPLVLNVAPEQQVNGNRTLYTNLELYYPMFQDIHVMMFIGFGFLMTFLKKYGFSAVGINFVLAAFVLQWGILVEGFFDLHQGYIQISVTQLIAADFAAAAVLISMGALLGKLSPEQYIIMGFLEVVFYVVNEYILFELWNVSDAGDSMTVHAFGAYFGLTVARIMYRKGTVGHAREGSSYTSDIFAMIGTIFLWLYWPSFNGGLSTGDQRHRAVMNTYISLAACCVVTFAISALLDHENKFNMVHIQNSTLAGGVAIGTSANMAIHPFGAMIVGSIAAIVSVVGYKYITPFLARRLNLHDTCGVNNLHGMPGVLAAIVGAIVSGFASHAVYGHHLFEVFPEMNDGRSAWGQLGFQFAGLGVTLGIAIVGGAITGFILKLPCWIQLDEHSYHDDEDFWEVPAPDHVPHELETGQLYLAKRDINGEMELEKVQHGQVHHYA